MGTVYDSNQLQYDIDNLKKNPLVKVRSIGESVQKKPIHLIEIGTGTFGVHWNGGFHGNEWMTSKVLMAIIQQLIHSMEKAEELNDGTINDIFKRVKLSVVPMVNPDGVDLAIHGSCKAEKYKDFVTRLNQPHTTFSSWKANIRGVDLNKQFPAGWKIEKQRNISSPSYRGFPGYAPLTEPEALAMAEFIKEEPVERLLCFHSQGEVIYYGYDDKQPGNSEKVVKMFEEESDYEPICTLDSHAGMKDWFIDVYQKEGYTIEIGKGINPLPFSQYKMNVEKARKIAFRSLVLS